MDFGKTIFTEEAVDFCPIDPGTNARCTADDGTVTVFKVVSRYSKKFVAQEKAFTASMVKTQMNSGRVQLSEEQAFEELLNRFAAYIVGWEGVQVDGVPFEYSPDNAKTLLREVPWLRDELASFVVNNQNFLIRS